MKRLVDLKTLAGETHGKLFVRKLKPSKLMEFEDDFYKLLERVQYTPSLISREICVWDVHGFSRSLRRGVTAHSKNMRIDKELRAAINRWGKEANTKLGVARMDMADTYITLESIMPLMLEFLVPNMIHLTSRDALFACWIRDSGSDPEHPNYCVSLMFRRISICRPIFVQMSMPSQTAPRIRSKC